MSIWKCFQMAMSSIVGNKMRSILTMLGIIIGITAVIALVSLMSGMTSEITDAFEEMGIESINVSIQDRSATKEVKPEEMEQLAEEHSDIIAGQSPTVSMPAFIKNGSDTISTQATGVNEYYLGMKKYNITYGRELTYVDVERKQKVCVIGTYIAKEIFGGDALGKSIQITLSLIHISEPTRRTPISYAVFCLKKKKKLPLCLSLIPLFCINHAFTLSYL